MTTPEAAFFVSDGEAFVATEHATGPWSPEHLHAGPPTALIGRCIERSVGEAPYAVARVTAELLRPIPRGRLRVEVSPPTGGKRVRRIAASMFAGDDEVVRVVALLFHRDELALPPLPELRTTAIAPPDELPASPFPFFRSEVGYHTAMEVRFARGGYYTGDVAAWLRARVPLVAGEDTSPLARVLTAADSGNGVSNVLPDTDFLFINADLTVHLHRPMAGEWICLEAYTAAEPHGYGLAQSRLHDTSGPIGHALQSLLVTARG